MNKILSKDSELKTKNDSLRNLKLTTAFIVFLFLIFIPLIPSLLFPLVRTVPDLRTERSGVVESGLSPVVKGVVSFLRQGMGVADAEAAETPYQTNWTSQLGNLDYAGIFSEIQRADNITAGRPS